MGDFLGADRAPPYRGTEYAIPEDEPAPRRRRRWVAVSVAALVVAGLAVVAWQLRGGGIDHPDAWDDRVAPFASAVEAERKLSFEHPIYVDFLDEAQFEDQVTADEGELTEEDRAELEQYTRVLRALGLVSGDFDFFESMNELRGAGVIGYYSYEDQRIRIKGTELTPAVQSTLVHELTHALQDQHFDLRDRLDDYEEDPARETGFRALVEGDARRIETAWREGLSKAERDALDEDQAGQGETFEDESAGVPKVLATLMSAPYVFGEALLQVVLQQGGDRAVDGLFLTPPSTEEHQLDPWTLVVDHQGQLYVEAPELNEGEEELDDGPFGAIGWLVMLSERLPVGQALTAADGWGGDSYVAFERDDQTCVRIDYAGDTPKDLAEMRSALQAWVARGPRDTAEVRHNGSRLAFESCDPGGDAATSGSGGSQDAVRLAVARASLSVQLITEGGDIPFARCASDRLVRAFTVAELNDPELDPARVVAVLAPCRP